MTQPLGKLTQIKDLCSVWKGDASHFVPWLAQKDNFPILAASRWSAAHRLNVWLWERKNHGRVNSRTRYSLIVLVATPGTEVELYTPIALKLGIPVTTEI